MGGGLEIMLYNQNTRICFTRLLESNSTIWYICFWQADLFSFNTILYIYISFYLTKNIYLVLLTGLLKRLFKCKAHSRRFKKSNVITYCTIYISSLLALHRAESLKVFFIASENKTATIIIYHVPKTKLSAQVSGLGIMWYQIYTIAYVIKNVMKTQKTKDIYGMEGRGEREKQNHP